VFKGTVRSPGREELRCPLRSVIRWVSERRDWLLFIVTVGLLAAGV
jgi:hypothetical protein